MRRWTILVNGPWGGPPAGGGGNSGGQSNGGSNGGGSGDGPRRVPPRQPDFNDIFRQGQNRFRKFSPRDGQGSNALLLLGLAVILVLWLASGLYRVRSDEVGIEVTFGEWTNREKPAAEGLHYHWPAPVGQVFRPVVTRQNRVTIGFDVAGRDLGARSAWRDQPEESLMLTGDENIIEIDFAVFWRMEDPGQFLFNFQDPEEALKTTSESVMREVVGLRPIDAALADEREEIERTARERIQALMSSYRTGITIEGVQLLEANPPAPVVPAFNDVQSAEQDKDKLRNEAEAYRNDILPRARGQQARTLQEAEAYRDQMVNRARGDAERFVSVYNAYKQARDVTAQRLYLETMEDVLGSAQKIIIDQDASKAGGGVIPYLPLPAFTKQPQPANKE
jgi:modulator of FtsH protease HflK